MLKHGEQTVCSPHYELHSCGAAATHGVKTFDHYTDPETGKEGKTNVSVTVGAYRGNKLVSFFLSYTDPFDMLCIESCTICQHSLMCMQFTVAGSLICRALLATPQHLGAHIALLPCSLLL